MPLRKSVADIPGALAAFASPAAWVGDAVVKPFNKITPSETASTCRFMVCRPFPPGPTRTKADVITRKGQCCSGVPPKRLICRSISVLSDMDERGTDVPRVSRQTSFATLSLCAAVIFGASCQGGSGSSGAAGTSGGGAGASGGGGGGAGRGGASGTGGTAGGAGSSGAGGTSGASGATGTGGAAGAGRGGATGTGGSGGSGGAAGRGGG